MTPLLPEPAQGTPSHPGRCHNMGNPSETYLIPNFPSYAVVLCAKYQNDWATEIDAMDERDFARFEFKMSSVGKSCIATSPRWHYQPNTMCEDDLAKPGARASSALILDKHFNGIANMPHQYWGVYVLRPEQNGQYFTNYIYECIFRK